MIAEGYISRRYRGIVDSNPPVPEVDDKPKPIL
jgi:hypothetical protein